MESHIFFDTAKMELRLLDQRLLPDREEVFVCRNYKDVIEALRTMVVRGAPAIGVTGAWGCVLALNELSGDENWRQSLHKALAAIATARPTAVNLRWAVNRMHSLIPGNSAVPADIIPIWLEEAKAIQDEDIRICRQIGYVGSVLIQDGDTVLTHCNAGSLATAGYGTALGVIRAAVAEGKNVKVIADETRPFFQGARLTAFELKKDDIPVTVACDNACALLMQRNMVQLVITGADRVAANGDTANKIGTFAVAILARYFHIPFYIACPLSTIDPTLAHGGLIPIEQRPSREVEEYGERRICPQDVPVYNFAFDVTPAHLIDGIITEAGILRPPYAESIAGVLARTQL